MSKVKCLICGSTIESLHTHDFKRCECDNVYIDGGKEYFRIGWKEPDKILIIEDNTGKEYNITFDKILNKEV